MDEGNLIKENEPERRKLSRTHNWYSKRSKPVRFILIIVMLALLILILEGLLLFGLWIESLRGGLAVFVQPENTKVEIPLLGSSEVSFDISVQNLPLCKAICDWEIKRQDTNEIMSYGRDEILSGTTNTLTVNVEAGTQRKEFPIVLSTSCQNELARHCRRNSEPSIGRTITIVTFEDTIESGIAREYLEGEGRLRLTQRQELLADLNAILELDTILIPTVKTMARQQADIIKESLEEVRIAYDNDNPIRARAILEPQLNYSAYEEYMNAVRLETDTINKLRNASSNFDRIGPVGRVANEQDRDSIIALTSTIKLLSQRTNTTDIFLINKQIEQAERSIREMITKYEAGMIEDAQQGIIYAIEEKEAMCRIKNYDCQNIPLKRTINNSIEAFESLEVACNIIVNLEEHYSNANNHYASLLEPNMSLFEVEALYNVSGLRAQTEFLSFETQTIRLARQGRSINATERERLAIRLDALSTGSFAFRSKCDFNLPIEMEKPIIPQKSLPEQLETRVIRERFSFPNQQCCNFGVCSTCEESEMYPVMFLHGHSFAESSFPEYNIQAFTKMARELENQGYIYAGNIFPQTQVPEQNIGLYKNIQRGVLFTATYYYDSFEEDKTSHITPRKSENIETYAIRLREAIDATLKTTDSEKVIIVAHSMGGLVARSYIATFGEEKIAGLVMIGTPNYGVTDEVGLLCPLFGSNKECEDLKKDSFFLRKLNSYPAPRIPIMTIAGYGCKDGPHDGLVAVDNVQLDYARNEIVNGTCLSRAEMLHGYMLKPERHPETLELVSEFLNQTGVRR